MNQSSSVPRRTRLFLKPPINWHRRPRLTQIRPMLCNPPSTNHHPLADDLADNPYQYDKHVALITALKLSSPDLLPDAFDNLNAHFPLPNNLWVE